MRRRRVYNWDPVWFAYVICMCLVFLILGIGIIWKGLK